MLLRAKALQVRGLFRLRNSAHRRDRQSNQALSGAIPAVPASDLTITPVDALTLLATARRQGGIASINGGGCCIVGGHFAFTGDYAGILLGVLPPIVHLRKESDKETMRWSLERMRQELLEPQPGGSLVAQHLAHMMLVLALRLHLAEGLRGGVGWLFALADKQMGAAITSMHDDPAHR
jgi:hypothetical protein